MREPITKQDIRTIVGAVSIQVEEMNKLINHEFVNGTLLVHDWLKAGQHLRKYKVKDLFNELFEEDGMDMYNYYVLVKARNYGYLSKGEKYYLLTEKLGL